MNNRTLPVAMLALAAFSSLGCTRTLSAGIKDDGTLDTPVFANERFLRADGGSYPDPAALGRIGPGMNKTQLIDLIGTPHFREGYAAREWDYLFLFRTGQGDRSCHYKVVFDRQYRAQTLLWLPASCETWVASLARPAPAEPAKERTKPVPPMPMERDRGLTPRGADASPGT